MKKPITIVLLLFLSFTCIAQNGKILSKKLINIQEKIDAMDDSAKAQFSHFNKVNLYAIVYLSDSLKVKGLLCEPKLAGNYPCIIYNRGGNRNSGQLGLRQVHVFMAPYAAEGYVVIASNYRGNGGSEGQEEFGGSDVNDVLNLIPALAQVEKADTSRIGIFGHSRGGMMTYKSLKNKHIFKTAVVIAGSANSFTCIRDRPEMETRVYAEIIPDYYENKDEILKDRSVVFWPEKLSEIPLLLLHGTEDKRVNYEEVEQLSSKLDSLNYPYQLISFEGDDHGLTNHRQESQHLILNWFNKYLRNGENFDEAITRKTVN